MEQQEKLVILLLLVWVTEDQDLLFSVLRACKFIKKRLQHRCFPVKFAKFRTLFWAVTSITLTQQLKNNQTVVVSHSKLLLCFTTINKFRSSHQRRSIKKAVLKIFAMFTGKNLGWRLFLIKLQAWMPATLL